MYFDLILNYYCYFCAINSNMYAWNIKYIV